MKQKTNESMYDGSFILNGDTIYYHIVDDKKPIRTIKGVEKISRYINFYDINNNHIGVKQIYGDFEDLSNISSYDAEEWYTQLKNNS